MLINKQRYEYLKENVNWLCLAQEPFQKICAERCCFHRMFFELEFVENCVFFSGLEKIAFRRESQKISQRTLSWFWMLFWERPYGKNNSRENLKQLEIFVLIN